MKIAAKKIFFTLVISVIRRFIKRKILGELVALSSPSSVLKDNLVFV